MMVGEVYLLDDRADRAVLGDDDELHLSFDFELAVRRRGTPAAWRDADRATSRRSTCGAWPTWVFSNHDQPRHAHALRRLGGPRARRRACCCSTLRGTPFLYAGEELGLEDADVPPERVVDPGGRDGCRAPIPWTRAPARLAGRPVAAVAAGRRGARAPRPSEADPGSMLHLYRAAAGAAPGDRRRCARATLELLDDAPDGRARLRARPRGDRRRVWLNFGPDAIALPPGWTAALRSDGGDGPLPADAAAILAPAA